MGRGNMAVKVVLLAGFKKDIKNYFNLGNIK